MARTRTQQTAAVAAAATARASALQNARRTRGSQRMTEQPRSRAHSKVQFSDVVQVKEITAEDGSPPNRAQREAAAPAAAPYAKLNRKVTKSFASRRVPKTNIYTMASLPSPPSSASTPSIHSPGATRVNPVSRRNVVTLTDFPRAAHRNTGPSVQANGLPSPTSTNEPSSVPFPEVQQRPTGSRSSLLTDLSPTTASSRKRPRADSSTFYQPPPKRQQFEYDARTDLKSNLRHAPRALAPEEISALFQVLREELHRFAFSHFHFEHTPEAQADWPLHDMGDSYYPLMLTAQYIADGSQYGWRHFFTTPDSRASLVYGVIAEYLRHHVFSVPAFGFSEEDTNVVESVDTRHMHYDAQVRARHRAMAFRSVLDERDWNSSSRTAIRQLAEDLLTILTPLLPPEIFSYDRVTCTFGLSNTPQARDSREMLLFRLSKNIQMAVNLHYSIRLTGANGSVVRFCNGLHKGDKWFGDYSAPQNCVNKDMMQKTQFHGWISEEAHVRENALDFSTEGVAQGPDDKGSPCRPRIKMVCFPRIEMIVPHGPDQEQLAEIEQEYRRRSPGDTTPFSESAGDDATPTTEADDIDWNDHQEWVANGNAWHYYLKGRDHVWEKAPEMVKRQHEDREGPWPAEAGDLRLPYMDHYQWLSVNDVYLEHDYVEPTEEEFINNYFHQHSIAIAAAGAAQEPNRLHSNDKDDDDESDSNSSSSSSSSSSSASSTSSSSSSASSRSTSTVLTWAPNHTPTTARSAYASHIATLRNAFLPATNAHTGWTHGLPLPASQRISLHDAVAHARAAHLAAAPRSTRLRAAAQLSAQTSWNALAAHATAAEGSVIALALLAVGGLAWVRGSTSAGPGGGSVLPRGVLAALQRGLSVRDLQAWVAERLEDVVARS